LLETLPLRYELERLKPAASNLCGRISSLPVTSTKQRLAQSEIAKKVSPLVNDIAAPLWSAAGRAEIFGAVPSPLLADIFANRKGIFYS
jgi:hypothetical protein